LTTNGQFHDPIFPQIAHLANLYVLDLNAGKITSGIPTHEPVSETTYFW